MKYYLQDIKDNRMYYKGLDVTGKYPVYTYKSENAFITDIEEAEILAFKLNLNILKLEEKHNERKNSK